MAAKAAPRKNLSALKRDRQSEKRNVRNRMARTKIKNVVKGVESAVQENDPQKAASALLGAVKTIDSLKAKGIIHSNNAARKVSRLTRRVNAVSGSATA